MMITSWYLLASVATLLTYWWDKRRARVGGRRVSERNLQLLALGGGWLGAHAGRALFGHKTRKLGFSVVLWLITLFHVVIILVLLSKM
jgi:uncharacterized membrane protein YsdA (DUF1294 family)